MAGERCLFGEAVEVKKEMKKLGFVSLAMLTFFGVVGCGGAGDALIGNRNPRVRLVNAFPGTNVDASFTDSQMTQNVMANEPYGTFTTEFIPTNGINTVRFSAGNGGPELANDSSLYELNKDYTVVGYGGPGNRRILIASEAASPLFGRTAFRVMNTSDSTVDVFVGASGSTFANANRVKDNLASGTILPYGDYAAGTMRVFITNETGTVVLDEEDLTFETGKTYTIIVGQNPTVELFKINSF